MSKIFKNTSLYAIGNVLPQVAGFFLLPIYTRYLTPGDYGIVSSMQVLGTMLVVFFTLAIDRSIYRLYFDYKSEADKKNYLGTITIGLFIISIGVLALLFLFRGMVGQIYKSISFYPFYAYAILTAFFSVYAIVPKIYFQLNEKAGIFVLLSVIQFLFKTAFTLWFVVEQRLGAAGMLEGTMLANIVIFPLFIYLSIKTINFKFDLKILKASLAFSLPMIPGLLSAWILNLSDRVFIERYFNLHEVGIYSLGYKIAGLVLILTSAFNLAYNPVFYKLANSEDQVLAKKQLFRYNHLFLIALLISSFLISFFSKEAIQLLLDPKYNEAYKIVPIIAFAYFISQASGLFNLMIYQEKKVTQLVIIGIIGAVLNVFLNFILVPTLGIYGAGYATILSFVLIFILSYLYAKKCYFIPIHWKKILLILLPLMFLVVLFQYVLNLSVLWAVILKSIVLIGIVVYAFLRYSQEIKELVIWK